MPRKRFLARRSVSVTVKNEKRAPELRFKGFTDVWEQRNLGELFARRNERNNGSYSKDSWISVAQMYYQNPSRVKSNHVETRSFVMHKGDIAFEGHPNREYKFGRFVMNDIGSGVVSELFPIYRPIAKGSLGYWKNAIRIEKIMAPIFSKSITSPSNSANKLNEKHFLRQKLRVPSCEEQTKIGDFLKQLDELIVLQQRKLKKLESLKQAYLQQLFPQKDEVFPPLRFAGFTTPWNQRKLKSLVVRISLVSSEDTSLPRVEYEDVVSGRGQLKASVFENPSHKKGTKFEPGDILFGKLRPYLKNWLLASFSGVAVGDWWVLRPNNTNSEFLYTLIQSPTYQTVASLSSGTRMPRSDWRTVSETDFSVPKSTKEQEDIGLLFHNLDNLIALNQRKLDAQIKQKKALLQRMFV